MMRVVFNSLIRSNLHPGHYDVNVMKFGTNIFILNVNDNVKYA